MKQQNSNTIDTSYITVRDIFDMFFGNIWLFLVSIAVCLAGAFYAIAITPPLYERTASIMIKEENKQMQQITAAAFSGSISAQASNDIKNEVYTLKTPQLMEEVVKRLNLTSSYSVKYKGLRWVDIYHSAPFEVVLDEELSDNYISLEITTDGKSGYEIESLVINGNELALPESTKFGEKITTPYGVMTINNRDGALSTSSSKLYSYKKGSVGGVAAGYSAALSVVVRDISSSIIDMTMTLGSTQKAEDILNMLISVYKENWIKDKNMVSLSTTNFINERLAIITKELGAVDQTISTYKSENLLPDVGAVTGMNLAATNEIFKQQVELNNQLSMVKYILQYIESSSTGDQLLPVNSGIGSSTIDGQIAKYNELLLQKNALMANSSAKNPVVAQLVVDLETYKQVLVLSMNDLINTIGLKLESARKEEIDAQKRLSNNPSQELYLLSTGREQMIKEQLYLYLLQKREENELNQAFTAYNTKVLSLAQGSNTPVSPKQRVIILFGLCVGCILPVLYLILRMSLNTSIMNKEDLKGLQTPYLGSIPLIGASRRGPLGRLSQFILRKRDNSAIDGYVVVNNSRDVVNESFRVVRTNLDFISLQESECRTFNLTSYNPGSGKSFISLNLAVSMALKDKKVLVIDADFRKGTLSQSVDSPRKGSVNYLNGSVSDIDSVIVKGKFHPHLDVLPMGSLPPNPTELLLTDRFTELMTEMKSKYDYIFLDCPPVEIVPDAMIVEKLCDSTIFIVRAGLMDKRQISDLAELYESKRLKSMSILLNAVDYRAGNRYGYGRYGYGRYGYGGYGYGAYGYGAYGYGAKSEDKAKS
ncbi:MAG: polysaccharide biosynthesis tyrosine autokinase [Rikenellaceae bacterium]